MGFFLASVGDIVCQTVLHWLTVRKANNVPFPSVYSDTGDQLVCDRQMPHNPQNMPLYCWDQRRTLKMGICRAFGVAPFITWWFPVLASMFPSRSLSHITGRTVLDQTIGVPIGVTLVFSINLLMDGRLQHLPEKLKQDLVRTWSKGLQFGPMVNLINFKFVPLEHQPVFAHCASIYWNSILSYYTNTRSKASLDRTNIA